MDVRIYKTRHHKGVLCRYLRFPFFRAQAVCYLSDDAVFCAHVKLQKHIARFGSLKNKSVFNKHGSFTRSEQLHREPQFLFPVAEADKVVVAYVRVQEAVRVRTAPELYLRAA